MDRAASLEDVYGHKSGGVFMGDEGLVVSDRIRSEVGLLLDELRAFGWTVSASRYDRDVMGNWFVDISRREVRLRLIKDRGQYSVDGPRQELAAEGLWRVYDAFDEFSRSVVGFATR
jgi:hypothetical protein